jgi:RimJ/RimL family protein N-acetyltransferase
VNDETITLRPLTLDDVEEWMAGEDDEQIRWFEFPGPAPRDNVVAAIRDWESSWRTGGPVRNWAICDRRSDHILGGVEIRDLGEGKVNLSYVVFPEWRRQGIATRACRLALSHAANEMTGRVAVITVLAGNDASLGVARKLGASVTNEHTSQDGKATIVLRLDLTATPQRD